MNPKAPELEGASAHAFLTASGKLPALIAAHDWSASPLGAIERWPQSLRSVVGLMLASKFPMFVAWGAELTFLYNDAYAEILGSKHPSALGRRFVDIWSEIWPDIEPLIRRALAGEATFSENLPLTMHRKGFDEATWFTFSYSPVRDDDGAIAGMFCACTETTAVVLAERSRLEANERLRSLFHQAPGFMAVIRGSEHVFELVNAAYQRLIGDRDVVGRPLRAALPDIAGQGFFELLDRVHATGEPYTGRGVSLRLQRRPHEPAEERFVDFLYQPLTGPDGRVSGIFVQGHDVTEQYRAQEELRAFSDSIPALAWTTRPDGRVERFNAQWYAYTGQSEAEALGSGWLAALHPEDRSAPGEAWGKALPDARPWSVEYRIRARSGGYRWFLARAVPQRDADGRILRWFGTSTDIDDAKRAEQALTEADRQKDEFLATLAHELRNPLAPIRNAAAALASPGLSDADLARTTAIIRRQVGHMAHLLDDLLDVSRITRRQLQLKLVPTDLADVVSSALETARPLLDARGHRVDVAAPEGKVVLYADPVRLSQVLSNLLTNAAKYTDPGGHVEIRIRVTAGHCSISVRDSGIGIAPGALESVFTMFAQEHAALDRSEGGLGIGLALVKGLVELHGGRVEARSEGLGRGSEFIVHVPLEPPPDVPVQSTTDAVAVDGRTATPRGARILLAEDNADARESLATWLRLSGHTVSVAGDGIEALAVAERERPEVMVLDIGMPRLNGYDLARRLRALDWTAGALLIAMTGWGRDDDQRRAREAGFDRHLTKPFDPDQLLELLARHPDGRPAPPAA